MFDMSMPALVSGLLIGGVGAVLFFRGKRECEPSSLMAGIALSVLPLTVHSVAMLWLATAGVMGGWGVLRKFGSGGGPVA